MNVNGFDFPVICEVEVSAGVAVPLLDIPMMSDEKWQQSARENAVHNYIKTHGRKPESVEAAVKWQHESIRQVILEYEGYDIDEEVCTRNERLPQFVGHRASGRTGASD